MANTLWDRKDILKHMVSKGDTINTVAQKIKRDRRNVYGWLNGEHNSTYIEYKLEEYFKTSAINIRKAWANKQQEASR